MRKINLPKDLLYELYVVKGLTTYQIADELGVNRQTISNKLKDYNIKLKDTRFKPSKKKATKSNKVVPDYRDKDLFEKKYKELKAIDLVAEYFNINVKTAYNWKSKHNIKTIKEFSKRGLERVNGDKPWYDREFLEDMYSKYSTYELAELWNCDPTTIQKWLKRLGIKTRTVKEQWELKSKFGSVVVSNDDFDLQEYINTYVENDAISKRVVRYIKGLVGSCQSCGFKEVLDLHHINGNRSDNRPQNHVILCPNCHAKIHRLDFTVEELCPNYTSWNKLLPKKRLRK